MIEVGTPPDKILGILGITEPEDLDIEAIAYACGATIVPQPLTGCQANIIGFGDRAIITVNSNSIPTRQRFSSGHELGHWMRDRGQNAFGCLDSQLESEWTANNPEVRANRFASDLLLPVSMFAPRAKGRPITLETVGDLATMFKMSQTATAIRLVTYGSFPAVLIYYDQGRRKWFLRPSDDIPSSLWPNAQLDPHSVAASLVANSLANSNAGNTRSDRWFEHDRASNYYVRESCLRTGPDSILVLLWWEDEQQLVVVHGQMGGAAESTRFFTAFTSRFVEWPKAFAALRIPSNLCWRCFTSFSSFRSSRFIAAMMVILPPAVTVSH